jgi:hypothetical protein
MNISHEDLHKFLGICNNIVCFVDKCRDSSVGIATGYELNGRCLLSRRDKIILFSTLPGRMSRDSAIGIATGYGLDY